MLQPDPLEHFEQALAELRSDDPEVINLHVNPDTGELLAGRDTGATELALADGFRATDAGNAERLVAAADGHVRYVHGWAKWLVYSSGRWVIDSADALVTEQAKQVARGLFRLAAELDRKERDRVLAWASRCEQAPTIAAMLRLARGVPGVLVEHEELDRHPYLLNVANGSIDIRGTGAAFRAHRPDDLLTMQAPVIYNTTATCPIWDACLDRWQPDPEMRSFLQRAVGSAATGHPVENLFVNVGTGGNGKSKFFGAISHVLGPFAVVPHKSLLVAERHEGHPTHVAALFRARMLVAPETSDSDRLDEELVKNLTGGDVLEARRMREDPWNFTPSHTAFMHTNHRPRIQGVDHGIWRRVRLIPWNITIPDEEVDEHLADKLAAEASGILNWIIAGAVAWRQDGLNEPAGVQLATDEYRRTEDHVGKFLADNIDTSDDTSYITARNLRAAYETWCVEAGETAWTPQRFGRNLTGRGFDTARIGTPAVRSWLGMRLR